MPAHYIGVLVKQKFYIYIYIYLFYRLTLFFNLYAFIYVDMFIGVYVYMYILSPSHPPSLPINTKVKGIERLSRS